MTPKHMKAQTEVVTKVNRIILDKIEFGLNKSIPKSMIQHMKLTEYEDFLTESIVYGVRGYVLGKKNVAEVEYYADWWQELRERILPKWRLKQKPSVRKRVEFYIIYPTLNYASQEHEPVVKFSLSDIERKP